MHPIPTKPTPCAALRPAVSEEFPAVLYALPATILRMARLLPFLAVLLCLGCGDDDDDDVAPQPDAGVDSGLDAAAGDDGGGGEDGGGGDDAGTTEDECPAPPDDLPTDVTITEDGRYSYLDVFVGPDMPERSVTVVVPEGYDGGDERYPVVYLMDGSLAVGAWGADLALDALTEEGAIPPHILVAVNSTARRQWELTPDEYPDIPEPLRAGVPAEDVLGGGGPVFAALLIDVIKPFVDAHFRTRCGRENTAIGGFSLGGLMCMYFMTSHADVFGRGMCDSASYWWNNRSIVTAFEDYAGPLPIRLWLDVGTAEALLEDPETYGVTFRMVANARVARDLAIDKGMILGQDLGYYEQPDAPHDFDTASERLPNALAFLLSDLTVRPDGADSLDVHLFETDIAAPARASWHGTSDLSATLAWGDRTKMTWPNGEATFSSSAEEVATVDETGLVTAVSAGDATIEGTLEGFTATDDIEVH